jgi:hypothetical protein
VSDKKFDKIYLETTAAIDASFKSFPEVLSIIKSSHKTYTSQYTKMEIRRGFLNYLILLHNKIPQFEKWSEMQQFISNVTSSPKRYYLAAIQDALVLFWREIEKGRPEYLIKEYGDISTKILLIDIKSFLRLWIKRLLRKVDKLSDEILNPMKCFIDLRIPEERDNLFFNTPVRCNESSVECEIRQFFVDNSHEFDKVIEKLKSIPVANIDNETRERIKSLKHILKKIVPHRNRKFSNLSQNEKLCWSCGDAIHAVLAPDNALIVNRNEKHFNDICAAIGKQGISYKSPSF